MGSTPIGYPFEKYENRNPKHERGNAELSSVSDFVLRILDLIYTNVLLGEQSASKTDRRGSNPRVRALYSVLSTWYFFPPTWLDLERLRPRKPVHAGANPVVGSLVKLNPDGVADLHRTLRRSGPWFESRSGYLRSERLAGVPDEHGSVRNCKTRFNSSARH